MPVPNKSTVCPLFFGSFRLFGALFLEINMKCLYTEGVRSYNNLEGLIEMKDSRATTYTKTAKMPTGNYTVMLLMSIIFAAQFLGDPHQDYLGGLILKSATFTGFIGYSWLHTGPLHVASNMLLLAIFGGKSCVKIGDAKYILVYCFLGFAAAIAHLALDGRDVIGASGAIFGVLGLAVVLSWRKLSPIGPWLILVWMVVSVGAAILGKGPEAHMAHVGGFVAGMLLAIALVVFKQADNSDTDKSLAKFVNADYSTPGTQHKPLDMSIKYGVEKRKYSHKNSTNFRKHPHKRQPIHSTQKITKTEHQTKNS